MAAPSGGPAFTVADAAAAKDVADDIRYVEVGGTNHSAPVKWFWVELLDDAPWREIGFDEASNPIKASPSESGKGYWNEFDAYDFDEYAPIIGEVSGTDFEAAWDKFFDSGREGE